MSVLELRSCRLTRQSRKGMLDSHAGFDPSQTHFIYSIADHVQSGKSLIPPPRVFHSAPAQSPLPSLGPEAGLPSRGGPIPRRSGDPKGRRAFLQDKPQCPPMMAARST
ncbi:hypothetical protein T484DRAFT_3583681 [Baffinella frigidus]|nr:hypothetical protein T484DRAFT_3583681 [Cryptophyta sp. CCMP2293]